MINFLFCRSEAVLANTLNTANFQTFELEAILVYSTIYGKKNRRSGKNKRDGQKGENEAKSKGE